MKGKLTGREALIGTFSLTATIVLCVLIIQHRIYLDQIATWGYLGCFLVNLFSSGTFVVPGLGMAVTFTLGGVLNPTIVGAVAGIGEATGAVGAYLTGYGGTGLLNGRDDALYDRFGRVLERHGSKAVLLMAAIINPLYYPFAVLMGVLRFGLGRFFLMTWAGRTVKNMFLAYLGYFGLRSVLQWLGLTF